MSAPARRKVTQEEAWAEATTAIEELVEVVVVQQELLEDLLQRVFSLESRTTAHHRHVSNDAWRRPHSLIELATAARDRPSGPGAWQDAVARCRAASTLARIERAVLDGALAVDAATDAASDAWPSDYVEAFRHLGHDQTSRTETRRPACTGSSST